MAAASPKSPSLSTPSRRSTGNASNNSPQMQGVFGKCTEPVPTNIASIRQQKQAAERAKSNVSMSSPGGSARIPDDGFAANKTVSSPKANAALKKKAGSIPRADVTIFSPPEPTVHKVRTTQQHTDPFSENRVRAEIKKRNLLVPESCTKAPKAQSIRVSEATKAKWESPFAADDVTNSLAAGMSSMEASGCSSPSALSPTRSSAASPSKAGKRCPAKNDHEIFAEYGSQSPTVRDASQNSRYKHSAQGNTTMHSERTDAELTKERTNHKRVVNPPAQSMEGVFTVVEKKNRHPNYKFSAPFARQGSIAASVKIGGRRHKNESAAAKAGEVVTPFATNDNQTANASPSAAPQEYTGGKPRRVFADKHSSKTPFARHSSLPTSQNRNYSRRVFNQKATSPYAVDE